MKISFIALFSLMVATAAFGQTQEDFDALASFLDNEKLQYLQENNQMRYSQMAVLNKAYHVSEVGDKNVDTFPQVSEVNKRFDVLPDITAELINSGQLNLLGYSFEMSKSEYSYYRIGESTQILVIPPTDISLEQANLETY